MERGVSAQVIHRGLTSAKLSGELRYEVFEKTLLLSNARSKENIFVLPNRRVMKVYVVFIGDLNK